MIRGFSACPVIRKRSPGIVVTTSLFWKIVLLGTSLRKVTIDLSKEEIRVESRDFWFFRRRQRIRFRKIKGITYGYSNWSPGSVLSTAHDAIDHFTVGLRLWNDVEHPLFSFVGDGSFVNDNEFIPDWFYWDEFAFDLTGSQESESRLFAELLSNLLNVPIVRPQR